MKDKVDAKVFILERKRSKDLIFSFLLTLFFSFPYLYCFTISCVHFCAWWTVLLHNSNKYFVKNSKRRKRSRRVAKQGWIIIDSMLACVCSVIYHRWRQNVVKTKKWHMGRLSRVCLWCSYYSLTSSVIYYWTAHKNMESICFI